MIQQYLGIPTDYIIIGLAGFSLLLLIMVIICLVMIAKQKKRYDFFMRGKNGKSLEESLVRRLSEMDDLTEANASNKRKIDMILKKMNFDFSRYGIVKYDALDDMGGKLSFALALLDERGNGFVMNVVHSREACYSYMKEIIDGNSIVTLSPEEEEALSKAAKSNIE